MRTRLLKQEPAAEDEQPERLRATGVIGSRGAFVIPAALRRKLGLTEGRQVIAEESPNGLLIRPLAARMSEEERQRFFEEANRDYAALRAAPVAWQEVLEERALWDSTLMDGLDPDEVWTEDRTAYFKSEQKDG
ncbi:MAG TPA: AbrB/MazE/SpoVT family DNA-binding domain-containing protein [Dehalococcoidia bacterium]|nr:AbrB/MazE/SpoVT family DNA-binding domain-containing protein [Dehalococcoidia bacterium]